MMKKTFLFFIIVILCIVGYVIVRNKVNTKYGAETSVTYSAGSESEWTYGNHRKEFDANSACYARVGECIYAEKGYNIGNEVKVTYRFTVTGDCEVELAEGKAERLESGDKGIIEYVRTVKAQKLKELVEDVLIFRYNSDGTGSVSLEVIYDQRVKEEYDVQSTIYFVEE